LVGGGVWLGLARRPGGDEQPLAVAREAGAGLVADGQAGGEAGGGGGDHLGDGWRATLPEVDLEARHLCPGVVAVAEEGGLPLAPVPVQVPVTPLAGQQRRR